MIKGTPTKETIVSILDRLSSDNDFRERFLGDPAGALDEYGVAVDASAVPQVRKLPSKQEVAKLSDQTRHSDDPTKLGYFIFQLK